MYRFFNFPCLIIMVLFSFSFSRTIIISDSTKTYRIKNDDTVSNTFDTGYFMHKNIYNNFKKCCESHIRTDDLTKAILNLQETTFSNYDAHIQLLSNSYDTLKLVLDTLSAKTKNQNNIYIDSIKTVQRKLVAASDSINAANQNVQQLKIELNELTRKSRLSRIVGISGLLAGLVSATCSAILLTNNN